MYPRKSWESLVWSLVWRSLSSQILKDLEKGVVWSLGWRYVPRKSCKSLVWSLVWRYLPLDVLKKFSLKLVARIVNYTKSCNTFQISRSRCIDQGEKKRLWTNVHMSETVWPNLADHDAHLDQSSSFANGDMNFGKYKEQQKNMNIIFSS